ncbi:MAG TPA: hypothetical protein VGN17_16295 [Bryobacteraceae bacterium]
MEGDDRKYRQNGYQDSGRDSFSGPRREDRPRPQGPRPPLDVTGPRLPRMVQAVTAARCFNCSATLMAGAEFPDKCPKCGAALHCCKQCSYFEPSTRFQCLKPIPVRIAAKDQANTCELFKTRVTVARDAAHPSGMGAAPPPPAAAPPVPRHASDARAAFDNLFRKTE